MRGSFEKKYAYIFFSFEVLRFGEKNFDGWNIFLKQAK